MTQTERATRHLWAAKTPNVADAREQARHRCCDLQQPNRCCEDHEPCPLLLSHELLTNSSQRGHSVPLQYYQSKSCP